MDKKFIECMDSNRLMREYLVSMRHGFNQVFGKNAREECNVIVDELLNRGIMHIPNTFGPIEVKRWTY